MDKFYKLDDYGKEYICDWIFDNLNIKFNYKSDEIDYPIMNDYNDEFYEHLYDLLDQEVFNKINEHIQAYNEYRQESDSYDASLQRDFEIEKTLLGV